MRFSVCLTLTMCALSMGCTTHRFLDRNVTRQSSTLTDLMYQQVLDNVALFAQNRATLPHLAVIGDGTAQAQDSGTAGFGLNWNATAFTGANMPVSGSRQLMENWKLQPVMTAGRLRRLRCAFQFVFASPQIVVLQDQGMEGPGKPAYVVAPAGCVKCVHEFVQVGILPGPCPKSAANPCGQPKPCCLKDEDKGRWTFETLQEATVYADELSKAIACNFPTGWFCIGTKRDAKKCGCMAGHDCDTYAWLAPGGQDALARFTISVLALATLDPPAKPQEMTITLKTDKSKVAPALTDFLFTTENAFASAQKKMQGEGKRTEAFNHLNSLLPNLTASLRSALLNPNLDEKRLLELRFTIAMLKEGVSRAELPAKETMEIANAAGRAIQEIDRVRAPAPTTTIIVPETQDAFSRPGSMPLSTGNTGIEFTPSVPTP